LEGGWELARQAGVGSGDGVGEAAAPTVAVGAVGLAEAWADAGVDVTTGEGVAAAVGVGVAVDVGVAVRAAVAVGVGVALVCVLDGVGGIGVLDPEVAGTVEVGVCVGVVAEFGPCCPVAVGEMAGPLPEEFGVAEGALPAAPIASNVACTEVPVGATVLAGAAACPYAAGVAVTIW
jgi:hypothetical protein